MPDTDVSNYFQPGGTTNNVVVDLIFDTVGALAAGWAVAEVTDSKTAGYLTAGLVGADLISGTFDTTGTGREGGGWNPFLSVSDYLGLTTNEVAKQNAAPSVDADGKIKTSELDAYMKLRGADAKKESVLGSVLGQGAAALINKRSAEDTAAAQTEQIKLKAQLEEEAATKEFNRMHNADVYYDSPAMRSEYRDAYNSRKGGQVQQPPQVSQPAEAAKVYTTTDGVSTKNKPLSTRMQRNSDYVNSVRANRGN